MPRTQVIYVPIHTQVTPTDGEIFGTLYTFGSAIFGLMGLFFMQENVLRITGAVFFNLSSISSVGCQSLLIMSRELQYSQAHDWEKKKFKETSFARIVETGALSRYFSLSCALAGFLFSFAAFHWKNPNLYFTGGNLFAQTLVFYPFSKYCARRYGERAIASE